MFRFLPFVFLLSVISVFGIAWIVMAFDPQNSPWYIFGLFDFLLFVAIWGFLGLVLYFLRTRLYKRYSANWYFKTSFKMAFFIAFFVAIAAILAIMQLITTFNVVLAIAAIVLFAFWSYLGKKS